MIFSTPFRFCILTQRSTAAAAADPSATQSKNTAKRWYIDIDFIGIDSVSGVTIVGWGLCCALTLANDCAVMENKAFKMAVECWSHQRTSALQCGRWEIGGDACAHKAEMLGPNTAIHSLPMKRFQKNCCGLRCWPLGIWVEWGSGFRASRSPLFRKSSFVVG